jgi:hypothetical protein
MIVRGGNADCCQKLRNHAAETSFTDCPPPPGASPRRAGPAPALPIGVGLLDTCYCAAAVTFLSAPRFAANHKVQRWRLGDGSVAAVFELPPIVARNGARNRRGTPYSRAQLSRDDTGLAVHQGPARLCERDAGPETARGAVAEMQPGQSGPVKYTRILC